MVPKQNKQTKKNMNNEKFELEIVSLPSYIIHMCSDTCRLSVSDPT